MIDLHMHSTASDGLDSPKELIGLAKQKSIKVMSITDHDAISGLDEARNNAKDIIFINGTELTIYLKHPLYKEGKKGLELHLLGYNFNHKDKELINILNENKNFREERAKNIFNLVNEKLKKEKLELTKEEFEQLKKNAEGALGRPHLARLLMKKGYVKSFQEAFDNYLVECDLPKKEMSLEQATKLIRNAGGIIVLAHPNCKGKYGFNKISEDIQVHKEIIKSIREHLDGLECYYWEHSEEESEEYVKIARELDLIITAGSDHHGGEINRVGKLKVPDFVAKEFLERIGSIK